MQNRRGGVGWGKVGVVGTIRSIRSLCVKDTSTVKAARKVSPHWSQKTITQHCLSLVPLFKVRVANQLAFRVTRAATSKMLNACYSKLRLLKTLSEELTCNFKREAYGFCMSIDEQNGKFFENPGIITTFARKLKTTGPIQYACRNNNVSLGRF